MHRVIQHFPKENLQDNKDDASEGECLNSCHFDLVSSRLVRDSLVWYEGKLWEQRSGSEDLAPLGAEHGQGRGPPFVLEGRP